MTARLAALVLLAVGCGADAGSDPDVNASAGTGAGGNAGQGAQAGATGNGAGRAGASTGGAPGSQAGNGGSGNSNSAGSSLGGAGGLGGTVGSSGAGTGGGGGTSQAGAGGVGGGASGAAGSGGSGGGVAFPPNCTCLGLGPPACTPTGDISFNLTRAASPTADQTSAYEAITCAMTAAVAYYNCNTNITKQLNVTYVPSVATADSNFNGSIRFGSDHNYMVCATSMHEVGHALGVGTAPNWSKVSTGGLFNGDTAIAQLRAITGKADDVLHSDTQHFWPYGLNYASEAKSTSDLVNHVLIVTAMRKDLGL
jgi:hypothetical protein